MCMLRRIFNRLNAIEESVKEICVDNQFVFLNVYFSRLIAKELIVVATYASIHCHDVKITPNVQDTSLKNNSS